MKLAAEDAVALNRELWEKRVRAHLEHSLYPIEQVEAGEYSIGPPVVDEVGDVAGRKLLHLQCNAGADTLYWARRGADVTGVDFSGEAIAEAQRLASATGLPARFVCSDVYDLAALELGQFDVVFTSMGVLWWLHDLDAWADVVATHLGVGGFFYIHEIHPFAMTLRPGADTGLAVGNDYFGDAEPVVYTTTDTYYEAPSGFAVEAATECGWPHSMGEIVSSLARAGLRVEFLHEHDHVAFRLLPSLFKSDTGWRQAVGEPRVPLSFSLRARH